MAGADLARRMSCTTTVSQPALGSAMCDNAYGEIFEMLSTRRCTPSRHREQQLQALWWRGTIIVAQHPCLQRSSWSPDRLKFPWSLLTII